MALVTYFLDNEQKNIDVFRGCNLVQAFKIDSEEPWIPQKTDNPNQMAMKLRLSPGAHAFAKKLDQGLGASIQDPTSGLEPEWWLQFFRGFQTANPQARIRVLLDWDRTLTKTEGFIHGSFDSFESFRDKLSMPDLTIQDALEFQMGSLRRLFAMQNLFDLLQTHNASVGILTNNPSCNNQPTLMKSFMNVLTRNRPFQMICSRKFANKKLAFESVQGPLHCT